MKQEFKQGRLIKVKKQLRAAGCEQLEAHSSQTLLSGKDLSLALGAVITGQPLLFGSIYRGLNSKKFIQGARF